MGELGKFFLQYLYRQVHPSKLLYTSPFIQKTKQRSPTLVPQSQQRFHKLQFLQNLSCQKFCWDQARLSSLVNKQVVLLEAVAATQGEGNRRECEEKEKGTTCEVKFLSFY